MNLINRIALVEKIIVNRKIAIIGLINILLYIINPFLATVASVFFAIVIKHSHSTKIMIFNISIFMGILNSTKVMESDLNAYHIIFLNASKESFIDFLSQYNSDYLYYTITYLSSNVLGMNWGLFIFLITLFSYLLIFKSGELIMSKIKDIKSIDIVLGLLILAMFYLFFSLSAHLVRNFIAASIILYFISNYFFKNKNLWYLIPFSMMIHASAAIFSFVYLIPKKLTFTNISLYIVLVIICTFFLVNIAHIFEYKISDNVYLVQRLTDFSEFSISSSIDKLFMSLAILIIVLIAIQKLDVQSVKIERYTLMLIVLLLAGYALSEIDVIVSRILLYGYFVLVPLFLILFVQNNIFFRMLNVVILCVMVASFINNLLYGPWTYMNELEIISSNIFDYFNV
jgi:hypothetical protein